MITAEDKVLFEIGVGFNKLTPMEICRNEALYNTILETKINEYGYDGDSPYYDSVLEFAECLNELYNDDDEKLIQAIGEHNDWNMFGWAISKVSIELREYAKIYFSNLISEEEEDADFIGSILNDPILPS